MADVGQTQPLDSMQMLLTQLGRIERSIETLPAMLERISALTESTRKLETALRETTSELRARDEAQQRAIEDMRLRIAETMAAVGGISAGLQELRADIPKRLLTVERQIEAAMDAHQALNRRVGLIEQRQGDEEFRTRLEACANEFAQWRPWLAGMKWGLAIIGGIILTAITGALLWSLVQSGGEFP